MSGTAESACHDRLVSVESEATALAVKLGAQRLRRHGFKGRAPTLWHERADGSRETVNFQRIVAGGTGRRPGFTVNLYFLPRAVRRGWTMAVQAEVVTADSEILGLKPESMCAHTRLEPPGPEQLIGRWWHPVTAADAEVAAHDVEEAFRSRGQGWFEQAATLTGARALLGTTTLDDLLVLGFMELEELGALSPAIETGLVRWRDEALVRWLLAS